MALFNSSVGCFGNWIEFQTGTISMSSHNLEASGLAIKLLAHGKGYESGGVSSEVVFVPRFKFPTLNLFKFLISFLC